MRILILGYSKFVQNRILPAFSKYPGIRVDVASVSGLGEKALRASPVERVFNSYDTALVESKADIVYVSTVNSIHAVLTERALRRRLHVIVDKPAFISFKDAIRLTKLAGKLKLCLAESNIYAYHSQIDLIKDIFKKAGDAPKKICAVFSFPPMDSGNFRYSKRLGGGALLDLGPYAVSIERVFFNEQPKEIIGRILSKGGRDNINISFSMMVSYSQGRSLVGEFGFDTEYRNHIDILGAKVSVSLNRIFTTPPELENELLVQQQNKSSIIKAPSSDNFLNFFGKIRDALESKNYSRFTNDLLTDAVSLERLRRAVKG